ncbi:Aldehyde ferredoxin oxidoreductase [Desulfonatronospira thiodismutans ASO3-1]|uniref:Aldehyde ferredoxin oxidoreductase n=1 Tax=Desulfonatronospira thiodismutans ASO3-1 TaxID=555779 RepID=D6SP27_9BACT|nr:MULTISPECIES: aldehyde ferredoxin oxidoreductase family protein [Desulfonatronospira]EFI34503.1 Aldehyde ferredoxin oxidoreductase [Desulfonatronospira thiodismutans ASO3-1]RQD73366.1 MAG: aldehyde ferredoxin oxidoreductase [Desulfonatronospira sp. MSAO_Bac3]
MPFGYNGKILVVDLTNQTWSVDERDEAWYRTYWGGGSLASWYMLKEIPPKADPLGPDNVLVFAASVLCGSGISGFNRYTVAAMNPLTGGFGESEAAGYLGPALKHAGFDAVVLKGKSPQPVYLWINNGQVELRDAAHIWGKENAPTLDTIKNELGEKKIRIASIGPAGENMVRLACIINELAHANGRCGMGAVMGSKNLKAVAVRGDSANMSLADPDKLDEISKWHRKRIAEHMPSINMRKFGTVQHLMAQQNSGILPTRNWRDCQFEDASSLGWEGYEKVSKGTHTCYKCAVACKRRVNNTEEKRYGGPEYETLAALGSMCGVGDLNAVCKGHERCNALGLDTVGTGAVVSFAMELAEKGILSAGDLGGTELKFDDAQGMLDLIEKIGAREGIGDILSQGVKRAAAAIGRGAEEYAFHVKGQEPAFHDPRGKTGVGLGFALSPTGADHIEAPHEVPFQGEGVKLVNPLGIFVAPQALDTGPEKVRYFIAGEKTWAMNNTLGLCNFVVAPLFSMTYDKLCEAVEAITGWQTSVHELMLVAERSIVLARMFNVRQGMDSKDDKLFRRMFEPLPDGVLKGEAISPDSFQQAVDLYYAMMGWDEKGVPSKGTLYRLSLDWLANGGMKH